MTTKTCALPSCGKNFEAERADARYCSPACRGKASRERRRRDPPAPLPAAPTAEPAPPPPPDPTEDFASRVLSLEERLENLEADLDLAEGRQSRLTDQAARLDTLSRRLPSEEHLLKRCREVVGEETGAIIERIGDLEGALGLGDEPTAGSIISRVAALEITEPGSDQAARARIRRLEDRLAREINRGHALEQQIAVLAAGLRDPAGVVAERLGT